MPMQLFPHNKTAYEVAVKMLAERKKAAVIHPTGTGKSFIGFKLCEDNPDKTICWLSPSRYIYQTQIENLAETSDGYDVYTAPTAHFARYFCPLVPLLPTDVPKMLKK